MLIYNLWAKIEKINKPTVWRYQRKMKSRQKLEGIRTWKRWIISGEQYVYTAVVLEELPSTHSRKCLEFRQKDKAIIGLGKKRVWGWQMVWQLNGEILEMKEPQRAGFCKSTDKLPQIVGWPWTIQTRLEGLAWKIRAEKVKVGQISAVAHLRDQIQHLNSIELEKFGKHLSLFQSAQEGRAFRVNTTSQD